MSGSILSIDDLDTVLDCTIDAKYKWFKVGLGLGVRLPSLDATKEQHGHNLDNCYIEMLREWLNNTRGDGPTWDDLIRSFRSNYVRLGSLANEVASKFCPQLAGTDVLNDGSDIDYLQSTAENITTNDLHKILDFTFKANPKWFKVGVGLGLTDSTLEAFRKRHNNDSEDCYLEVLREWLNNAKGTGPTWDNLVEAFRKEYVQFGSLANEVAKKYCPRLQDELCLTGNSNPADLESSVTPNQEDPKDLTLQKKMHEVADWVVGSPLLETPSVNSGDNGDPKFCVSEATDPTHDHDMQVAMELQEAFDKEEEDLIVKALASRNPDHELLISEEQRDLKLHRDVRRFTKQNKLLLRLMLAIMIMMVLVSVIGVPIVSVTTSGFMKNGSIVVIDEGVPVRIPDKFDPYGVGIITFNKRDESDLTAIDFFVGNCQDLIVTVTTIEQFDMKLTSDSGTSGIDERYLLPDSNITYVVAFNNTTGNEQGNCTAMIYIFEQVLHYKNFETFGITKGASSQACVQNISTYNFATSHTGNYFTGLYIAPDVNSDNQFQYHVFGTIYGYNLSSFDLGCSIVPRSGDISCSISLDRLNTHLIGQTEICVLAVSSNIDTNVYSHILYSTTVSESLYIAIGFILGLLYATLIFVNGLLLVCTICINRANKVSCTTVLKGVCTCFTKY